MTCKYCGCEITEDNMIDENLDICDYCYSENEAMSGDNLDNYYNQVDADIIVENELKEVYIEDDDE
jgi:hypothetical protein